MAVSFVEMAAIARSKTSKYCFEWGSEILTKPDIDLRMLRCFEALVEERHVTRAADRMDMSQSGMSTTLARLRSVFGDPILVRTAKGMELSEQAPEIAGRVRRALKEIDLAISGPVEFEPSTAKATFNVMASDYVGRLILPQLMQRIHEEAPGIRLTVVAPQPNRIREALANSEVDLVVGFFHNLADGLFQTTITSETLVCLVRKNHPTVAETLSLEQYAELEHVSYSAPPAFMSSVEVTLDLALQQAGHSRICVMNVSSLSMMPRIVEQTDLIATLPLGFAQTFLKSTELRIVNLPIELEPLPVRAIWHEHMNANPSHRWLRRLVQDVGNAMV